MSSNALFVAEFMLTAFVILGFCAHQLWSLNKLARERAARKKPEEPPPEG
ncbi:MAG: hypothetical protein K2X45_13705 [Phreatobacter sp.]|nr:hypothetical protein [Phreatobacter sp.]